MSGPGLTEHEVTEPPRQGRERWTDSDRTSVERLVFFSDAVFAIAATLLAVDLRLPELPPDVDASTLRTEIYDLALEVPVFALSFFVVAGYWVEHMRMYRHIDRYEFRFVWVNLFFLAGIAFLPVPSAILGDYTSDQTAILFYAVTLAYIAFFHSLLWRSASRGRNLITPDTDDATIRYLRFRSAVPLVVSLIAVPVALVAPIAALIILAVLFVIAIPLGSLYFRWLSRLAGRT